MVSGIKRTTVTFRFAPQTESAKKTRSTPIPKQHSKLLRPVAGKCVIGFQ